ncbi:MAG TPA: helix-turn-helix domain-containing protein [Phycisphaerales bacterium]|nr:helix-turn-helix domain-containing protein [Phycisphaerales bacterium]
MNKFVLQSEKRPLPPPLMYSTREAAHVLGISERTLASRTKDRAIPCVRLEGRVLYPVKALEEWIARNQENVK